MLTRSDINERTAAYNDLLDSVAMIDQHGGFEGLSPQTMEYIEAAEPVGIDEHGTVALPYNYRPNNGPPLLMIKPGEQLKTIGLRGMASELRTARDLARLAGGVISATEEEFNTQFDMDNAYVAMVHHVVLPVTTRDDPNDRFILHVPRILVVNPNRIPRERLGSALAHEAEHWKFSLHDQPILQSAPNEHLTQRQILAASEKQALRASYAIEDNLGGHAGLGSVAILAEKYAAIAPAEAGRIANDLIRERDRLQGSGLVAPLASLVVERLFGRPDSPATDEEIIALRALNVIL